jgi:hypothetical protein
MVQNKQKNNHRTKIRDGVEKHYLPKIQNTRRAIAIAIAIAIKNNIKLFIMIVIVIVIINSVFIVYHLFFFLYCFFMFSTHKHSVNTLHYINHLTTLIQHHFRNSDSESASGVASQ